MNPACRSVLIVLACHLASLPAQAAPSLELKRFVAPGTRLLSFHAADLNGDGTQDYLVVLQRGDASATRPLLIIERDKGGALALRKTNDLIVGCESCGGVMGDPFQELTVEGKGFTVANAGGSRERWSTSFTFAYSRRDKTWQLVRAQVDSYDATEPDTSWETQVHVPPRDFGKIDIADFDPGRYLKKRQACAYRRPARTNPRAHNTLSC